MTSLLAIAVLLSTSLEADEPDVFAKARQAMLGGAQLPWLLLTTGSITTSESKSSEPFAMEWEPCQRRQVRGRRSSLDGAVFDAVHAVFCNADATSNARVDRNGQRIRYGWKVPDGRFWVEIDRETGLVSRARVESRWMQYDRKSRKSLSRSSVLATAELSDYKPVGTARLPHRVRLQAKGTWEEWTIERIEIVPLP
jgi:hypothetical protein